MKPYRKSCDEILFARKAFFSNKGPSYYFSGKGPRLDFSQKGRRAVEPIDVLTLLETGATTVFLLNAPGSALDIDCGLLQPKRWRLPDERQETLDKRFTIHAQK